MKSAIDRLTKQALTLQYLTLWNISEQNQCIRFFPSVTCIVPFWQRLRNHVEWCFFCWLSGLERDVVHQQARPDAVLPTHRPGLLTVRFPVDLLSPLPALPASSTPATAPPALITVLHQDSKMAAYRSLKSSCGGLPKFRRVSHL